MRSVELFAGAGGLAIGVSAAGFEHAAVLEWNHDACETIRANQKRGIAAVAAWPVIECDAKLFNYTALQGQINLVGGGPPCQPFSLGGKHRGSDDHRDMFPEAVRAVRELRPEAFIFENVKGLLRESFATYFEYVVLQLSYPDLIRRRDESWDDHLRRLEKHQTSGRPGADLSYNVVFQLLNAADFGVPQRRERVFIVGFRSDLGIEWSFPKPTHTNDALLRDQWISGSYWERHSVAARQRPTCPARNRTRVADLRRRLVDATEALPWATVRDALVGLPDPERSRPSGVLNHVFNPGARSYAGHTGSPLDEPAKTLKAGDHGVPGGENMLIKPAGGVRYFTVREAARLQTFPDDYAFSGPWSEAMRQLGNAVPVQLAKTVAGSVASALAAQA